MIHVCEFCKREFKYPYLLKKHLDKKLSCIKSEPKCNKCGKVFASKFSLQRHQTNRKSDCTKFIKSKYTNEKIEYMKKMIAGDYSTQTDNSTTTNTINSNNINNINVHIHMGANMVLPFGKEDTNTISKEMMYHILKFSAMPVMYLRMLHLNPKLPQNHNVILKNKKTNTMNIKTKDGWKEKSYMQFIFDYINNLQFMLDWFQKENIDDSKLTDFLKEKIADFDYKFDRFLVDDKILSDTKQWIKSMRQELIDSQKMLLETKRKDTRSKKGKDESLDIEEYKELFDKKILATGC